MYKDYLFEVIFNQILAFIMIYNTIPRKLSIKS